jgi:YD repeat-containing protein
VGNRLSSLSVPSYEYNVSNEITSTSIGTYSYDANGNTLTDPSGWTYTWDFENHLSQMTLPGGRNSRLQIRFIREAYPEGAHAERSDQYHQLRFTTAQITLRKWTLQEASSRGTGFQWGVRRIQCDQKLAIRP